MRNKRTNQFSTVLPKKKLFPKNKLNRINFCPKFIKIKEWEWME